MRQALRSSVEQLGLALRTFPWAQREAYADWLAQTHYHVRHNTRILGAAAARFAHGGFADRLHLRVCMLLSSEKRREALALQDLRALGGDLAHFPEHSSTRMLYEPQYYKIEHRSATSLFGFLLPLEATFAAHGEWLLEQLRASHAEPCLRFLELQARTDDEQRERTLAILEEMPESLREIVANMRQSTFAYQTMLLEQRRAVDTRITRLVARR